MSLDLEKLECVKYRSGKVVARCPACAEEGADRSGQHLLVADNGLGKFACVLYPGPEGAEHRKRIWAMAGNSEEATQPATVNERLDRSTSPFAPDKVTKARLPRLNVPGADELLTICGLRTWHNHIGLEHMVKRGLLWDADIYDHGVEWPAWVITDSSRRNAQARKYDGQPWTGIGGSKAKSLPGSEASWPIGAPEIGDRPYVVICEGQPDFCAALEVAHFENPELVDLIAPVCITGASNSIRSDALEFFAGKRVKVAAHNDPGRQGKEAALRWLDQVYRARAKSFELIDFSLLRESKRTGGPIKDLADYATLLDLEHRPKFNLLSFK